MSSTNVTLVDQALFGYADGHRQIASSLRLPSKDQYQLATASDLASGAKLSPDDSYLTGLPLTESKCFALIRTWAAPEMPRPGCVWSHVILVGAKLLATHGELADLLELFKRPRLSQLEDYDKPLQLQITSNSHIEPHSEIIRSLIQQYYSNDIALLNPNVRPADLESAIMAVWSQQWPRLRSTFSFRTATVAERRRTELVSFDVQIGDQREKPSNVNIEDWAITGANDALSPHVTPLRRFLWRYGRDLSSSRRHYRTLVELYQAVRESHVLLSRDAIQIFELMPDTGDGEILKRDMLGFGGKSPSLLPALAPEELLRLLISENFNRHLHQDELRNRFKSISPSQVPSLANFADQFGDKLGPWSDIINTGLVAAATREALLSPLPEQTRKFILSARPELISAETIAPLSTHALVDLAMSFSDGDTADVLARSIVQRNMGPASERLLQVMPSAVFSAAVELAQTQELDHSWVYTISSNAGEILRTSWPNGVTTTTELVAGLRLLRFPVEANKTPEFWSRLIKRLEDDVRGDDRVRFYAFLLRVALKSSASSESWDLVAVALPAIRPEILNSQLPSDTYSMLDSGISKFTSAAYWDMNKRILISLSYLWQQIPNDEILQSLDLTGDELNIVLKGAKEEENKRIRPWWWY